MAIVCFYFFFLYRVQDKLKQVFIKQLHRNNKQRNLIHIDLKREGLANCTEVQMQRFANSKKKRKLFLKCFELNERISKNKVCIISSLQLGWLKSLLVEQDEIESDRG